MTLRKLIVLVGLILAGAATPAAAKPSGPPEVRQILAGEPLTLRSDRAYLLLRIDTGLSKFSADILRIPDQAELDAYDAAKRAAHAKAGAKAPPLESFTFDYQGRPNFYELAPKKPLMTDGKLAVVLAEVPPGEYVFYGEGFAGFLYECLCLGTVGFSAPAGKVTDLGTMLIAKAWEPSPIPELAGEVDLGRSAVMDYGLFAVALRPLRSGDVAIAGLDPAAISAARLHAVGPFVDTKTLLINRLAAIPGVLAYDAGRVIDVASGKEAAPN